MKKLTFLLLIFCVFIECYPQDNMEMYRNIPNHQVFPPSPDAASLGKYGDYPVSLATGLVDITIPLFEISTKRIKLPITLSYHASGITVDEVASNVGLGWTLNAGGCIAISVKHREDFDSPLGFMESPDIISASGLNAISNKAQKIDKIYESYDNTAPLDKESDVYSYNFNGYSGQFRYNYNGEIVQMIKDGLRIEQINTNGIRTAYHITTPDGIRYQFDMPEESRINDGFKYVSTYYLSKIKDLMNNEEINFTYSSISYSEFDRYPAESYIDYQYTPMGSSCTNYTNTPKYTQIERIFGVLALTGISFPEGKISFILANDRKDRRKHRMDEIKLFNNLSSIAPIKKVKFSHSYFISDYMVSTNDSLYFKRLCLDGVTIDDKSYQFGYNSTRLPNYYYLGFNAASRPNYYSQDEWGFYNEKPNRSLLKYNINTAFIADRTTNPAAMKACSLEEIIYPTGGKTRFEFEANRGNSGMYVGGLRIGRILNFTDKNSNIPNKITEYDYGWGHLTPLYQYYTESWKNKHFYRCCSGQTGTDYSLGTFYNEAPLVSNRHSNGVIVYYSAVTETFYDKNEIATSKIYYEFDIHDSTYPLYPDLFISEDGQYIWFYTEHLYKQFMHLNNYSSGNLLRKVIFKVDNNNQFIPQQEIINEYTSFGVKKDTIGIIFQSRINVTSVNCGTQSLHPQSSVSCNYHYFDIIAESGVKKVTKSTVKNYFEGNCVTEETKYFYDALNRNDFFQHNLLTKEEKTLSNGDVLTTEYKYPLDYSFIYGYPDEESRGIFELIQRRIFNPVIEQASYIQKQGENTKKLVASTITTYKFDGQLNRVFPKNVYQTYLSSPLPNYTPSYIDQQNGFPFVFNSNLFTLVQTYDLYDSQGNVLQYTDKKTNISTSYIWGYNRSYPIAKIVGDQYIGFSNHFGGSNGQQNLYYWGLSYEPTQSTLDNVNSLRTTLPFAHVTTYTYKPLVGMLTATDPSGKTVYYEYDNFNRLKCIKDHTGKVIESYNYHYQNQ